MKGSTQISRTQSELNQINSKIQDLEKRAIEKDLLNTNQFNTLTKEISEIFDKLETIEKGMEARK